MKFDAKQLIGWTFIVMLLAPTIFFPFSGDLSVFMQCSSTIINGGKLYVDCVDIKPPLIYYLLAFIGKIIGTGELSIRIFDFVYQLTTIIILYFLLKKITQNITIALLSGILYSISYTILNYSNTVQSETFASLLILCVIFLHFSKKNYTNSFLIGACIGLLMGLKYTFGIVFLSIIFDDFLNNKFKFSELFKKSLITIFGIILLFLITLLPLLDSEIRNGFIETLKYLASYSSTPQINSMFFKNSLKLTGNFFGDIFSLFLFVPIFIAISQSFGFTKHDYKKNTNELIKFLIILSIILFLSIVIERKFIIYHFARLYIPLISMSAMGLYTIILFLKEKFNSFDLHSKFVLISLIIIALIFSPFPRFLNMIPMTYYYFKNKDKYNAIFEIPESATNNRIQHIKIASLINTNINNNDMVVVMNSGGNIINQLLNTKRKTKFTQSCFYFSNFYKGVWQKEIFDEIKIGKWIVIHKNDRLPHLFGHDFSTYEILKKDPLISKYVSDSYFIYDSTSNFIIFKRK